MADTKIEWADKVWNPITGCTKESAGCLNCYAQRMAHRMWGKRDFSDVQFHSERLDAPRHWKKPARIFVNSMGDLFHEKVSLDVISQIWDVMRATPQHTYLILTKRPDRMWDMVTTLTPSKILPNVWLGVTAENQLTADARIPHLLRTPAAVRFLSCEPLIGAVDLTNAFNTVIKPDWIIAGGETGIGARPMHPAWPRLLRDQCAAAGVPYFFKSWGEWASAGDMYDTVHCQLVNSRTGDTSPVVGGWGKWNDAADWECVRRFGKKTAGQMLDGQIHNAFPIQKG